jgi:hypothetical protein
MAVPRAGARRHGPPVRATTTSAAPSSDRRRRIRTCSTLADAGAVAATVRATERFIRTRRPGRFDSQPTAGEPESRRSRGRPHAPLQPTAALTRRCALPRSRRREQARSRTRSSRPPRAGPHPRPTRPACSRAHGDQTQGRRPGPGRLSRNRPKSDPLAFTGGPQMNLIPRRRSAAISTGLPRGLRSGSRRIGLWPKQAVRSG